MSKSAIKARYYMALCRTCGGKVDVLCENVTWRLGHVQDWIKAGYVVSLVDQDTATKRRECTCKESTQSG